MEWDRNLLGENIEWGQVKKVDEVSVQNIIIEDNGPPDKPRNNKSQPRQTKNKREAIKKK